MPDSIFEGFLEDQIREGLELVRTSELLTILPLDRQRYVVEFGCKGLVRAADGEVRTASRFAAGIQFGPNHLRKVEPLEVVRWFGPVNVWHPNIRPEMGAVCIGRMGPGVGLVELVYQLFEMVTWRRATLHDALNHEAAQWARNHWDGKPVEERGLRGTGAGRRELGLRFAEKGAGQ